jgi:NADH:ubiquinone oxidoreductase subunit 5 (subunit L)/multisubunit Na+/H+ antiporter MnhA subunit
VTFTIGAAALAGLPPLSLWVTKDLVLASALEQSAALYVVGTAAALVSAVYATKAAWWVWQQVPAEAEGRRSGERTPHPLAPSARTSRSHRGSRLRDASLIGLAVLAALLGGLPFAAPGAEQPAWWELALSGLLAIFAVALTWRVAGRIGAPSLLASWLGLERVAHAVVVRSVLGLARRLARVDDRLDRAVTAVAVATVGLARVLDRRGEGAVDGAVRGIADGARALGRLARRPQTGQVHHYYAQAVAALAVLALVVIVVR